MTVQNYNCLAQSLLAFLIVFNGRRPSDVAHATLQNYQTLSSSGESESLSVFKVKAPKNKKIVPVLFPAFAKVGIELLISNRKELLIKGDLLFGKPDGSCYIGTDVIHSFKIHMKLEKPDHISANGIRHYWATVTQPHLEVKRYMAKILGHDQATHDKFYEMPMTDIHLNKIGPFIVDKFLPSTKMQVKLCKLIVVKAVSQKKSLL